MLDTLRKSIRMLPRDGRRWWLALPLMALIGGAAEAGAAAAVFGLISIIRDPSAVASLPIAAGVAPLLPWQEPAALILQFTVLVALYHIAKNLLVVGMQYLRHRIGGESSAALACTMLRGYLLAPYPLHFRRNSAELIRSTTHCVGSVFGVLGAASALLSELLVGVGLVSVLLAAAPWITLATAAALAVLISLLLRWTRGLAERTGRIGHALNKETLQTLQHALGAIKEIKALGRESFFHRTFAEKQRELLALGYLGVTLQAIPPLVIETVFVCGALLLIALLTVTGRVGVDGLPLLGLFAYAGFRLIPMANRLTWRLNEIRSCAVPVRELYDDFLLVTGREWAGEDGDAGEPRLRYGIALENVSYTYPGAPLPALCDVSMTIRRGESVGFVGPTGAGKSTLVDVVIGLLPPSTGRVAIDGVELTAERARAWRRRLGYVPQSIFLLDDTIRRNVALGIPAAEIDEAKVRQAVQLAQLGDFVAGLPEGLDTTVGERGVRLSGGERQRIGIARALYHDPDVLVFDEATSALDGVTETAIASAIRALEGRKTVLMIAHRLTTVRNCDRIALIVSGRLADCGTFDELLAAREDFRRLVAPAVEPAAAGARRLSSRGAAR